MGSEELSDIQIHSDSSRSGSPSSDTTQDNPVAGPSDGGSAVDLGEPEEDNTDASSIFERHFSTRRIPLPDVMRTIKGFKLFK